MARKLPSILYKYRGLIERGKHYTWREGYSADGPSGGALYGWMTKAECRADARAQGARAIFQTPSEAQAAALAAFLDEAADPE